MNGIKIKFYDKGSGLPMKLSRLKIVIRSYRRPYHPSRATAAVLFIIIIVMGVSSLLPAIGAVNIRA